jgi:hypothetical protein
LLVVCRQPKSKSQRENPNESTLRRCSGQAKFGKHEKGPVFLYTPLFFRAFVPRQINGEQVSCLRDKVFLQSFSLYGLTMRPPTTDG